MFPQESQRHLGRGGGNHQVWTAQQTGMSDVEDEPLIIYADDRKTILITTNRDCALRARRMQSASTIWLSVLEVDAVAAMDKALEWLAVNQLPNGRVLKVRKKRGGFLDVSADQEEPKAKPLNVSSARVCAATQPDTPSDRLRRLRTE